MKPFFKPSSLLLYFLAFLVFFVIGAAYAGLTGAAKGQGLAGGAIVLGYGVMGALTGIFASLMLIYFAPPKAVVTANRILGVGLLISIAFLTFRHLTKEKKKEPKSPPSQTQPPKTTSPNAAAADIQFLGVAEKTTEPAKETPMGMGFFAPTYRIQEPLYFYCKPAKDEMVPEWRPVDSMSFLSRGYNVGVATAPPWLVPDHLKLDYGILYFRIKSVRKHAVEVIVNTHTQQTAFLDREKGNTLYWPDFLMSIHSVEFISPETQKVRSRPLEHAGNVTTAYSFFKPLAVQGEWMEVELLDDGFQAVGKGWIRWKKEGKMLITYNLLS